MNKKFLLVVLNLLALNANAHWLTAVNLGVNAVNIEKIWFIPSGILLAALNIIAVPIPIFTVNWHWRIILC